MALGAKLMMRQSQSLVMTPQLLQAIKLLQLSTQELSAFVDAELERNPLLERAESDDDGPIAERAQSDDTDVREEADWASDQLATDRGSLERDLGTDLENSFPDEASAPASASTTANDVPADSPYWESRGGSGASLDGDDPNLEAYLTAETSLIDHLHRQLAESLPEGPQRFIATVIIEAIDPTGYLGEPLQDIARRLGVSEEEAEAALAVIHTFEPGGIGARSLSECLSLQLKDKNRFDPAMAALTHNLDLLAKRDFAALKRRCGVDDEDLAEMIAEIRHLDPKPGLKFSSPPAEPVIPDVIVRAAPDGGWRVDLNSDALPRVIANRAFYSRISKGADDVRSFADEAWSNATWIVRSLEQRARTILKVASEIVRHQDAFFTYGVAHLRPLNLKTIADAVQMHESTISRVTANKFMATPRGMFEMKYFFTTAIAAADGGDAYSSEAVRHRIRQMIEGEDAKAVLSDDAIVDGLKAIGIEIARRTVAKYREGMRIPSSAIRRREKTVQIARAST